MSAKLAKIQGRPGCKGWLDDGGLMKIVPGRKTICSRSDGPPGRSRVRTPDGRLKSVNPWAPRGVDDPTVGVEWVKDMVMAARSPKVFAAAWRTTPADGCTPDEPTDEVVAKADLEPTRNRSVTARQTTVEVRCRRRESRGCSDPVSMFRIQRTRADDTRRRPTAHPSAHSTCTYRPSRLAASTGSAARTTWTCISRVRPRRRSRRCRCARRPGAGSALAWSAYRHRWRR